ncbi:hypothetical protein [Haloactinomyces albus]|uniref:Uncharacterized protein n=1 Tax=Haloactinomyces albus TaxID=1352928 RepID=A0AAE3ZJE6_9ACTN|nr:hypothetical protein [Haloactinomyces albus]MDR7301828.1 hypothetical protein [Haloactinomyces albus]MDR7304733.1 hypothetical protein [Haloactinomyces albus]
MIEIVSCVVAVCDTCRSYFDEDGEGVQHFATVAGARAHLAEDGPEPKGDGLDYLRDTTTPGWQQLADGRLRCWRCETNRLCTEHGHDWTPWQACWCQGRCTIQLRSCQRCGNRQDRYDPATTTEGGERA